jgi:protein-S-isoprenylcysteine O-methyltransferase Ste14
MHVLEAMLPPLVALSIPYVLWLDRYLIEPHDGAWAAGRWLLDLGRGFDPAWKPLLAGHARAWAVKGFFTAFMISTLPGNWANAIDLDPRALWEDPVALGDGLVAIMFMIDVGLATVGYLLTLRPLDSHIRSANPYMQGWTAALICYPPFVLMAPGGPLDYSPGQAPWSEWLAPYPYVMPLFAFALAALTGIYAWATVAFGLRFSNLTHRGILTHGPYRFTKHPAYLSKNLFWWLATLPPLVTTGLWTDSIRNTCILGLIGAVYYWRARTEEAHLGADPAYRAYAAWMAEHGAITSALRRLGHALRPSPDRRHLPGLPS